MVPASGVVGASSFPGNIYAADSDASAGWEQQHLDAARSGRAAPDYSNRMTTGPWFLSLISVPIQLECQNVILSTTKYPQPFFPVDVPLFLVRSRVWRIIKVLLVGGTIREHTSSDSDAGLRALEGSKE